MSANKITRQYGLWDSPISPMSLGGEMEFSDVAWHQGHTLIWHERRSDRGVLVVQPLTGEAKRDLNSDYSVRARLSYGGGDFGVGNGYVYFVDGDSGRIYRQAVESGIVEVITPGYGQASSPMLSPYGHWLLYVHSYEGQDGLGIVDADGSLWPQKLVSGDDFYMQPIWHPDGKRIAWIAWNHPNMPWDGTYLRIGQLSTGTDSSQVLPSLAEASTVAGGENISVFQPTFSPDGRYLAYVSDESGWWQIYVYDLAERKHHQLTHMAAEHGKPAWLQGRRTYGFSPDGNKIFFVRNKNGFAELWFVDLDSGEDSQLDVGEEYTWLEQIAVSPDGERVALIASGGRTPQRVVVHEISGKTQVYRRSMAEKIPAGSYSSPQAISWDGMDGDKVHGLYYTPQSEVFEGSGLTPLIVLIHGGPTSQRYATFYPDVQFFTSRGYAVLQVNYRGSTGYGRVYRNKLRGSWGIYDVEDAISGVHYLVELGHVDKDRVVIMGGSAGGFTVLKALEDYPGFFKAGISRYGVSNQFNLVEETHKFESHYSDQLLGRLPEAADVYRERSPIFFIDKIQDPLAVFQGEDDKVVPRIQSDEVVASLRQRGVPHIYHVYPGEEHGFRKAKTIEHYYKEVEKFLREYVIYA